MNQIDTTYINSTVEALILASPEPISSRKIIQVIEDLTPSAIAKAVAKLNERYSESGVSFRIREIAGGYQFFILPEYVGYVEELFARRRKLRLTRAALETAAIVAYRQPVTKVDIEHIRGVASDGVLNNLLEKKLITIVGRAETVGKPLQYGTTDEFLKFFGLNSIKDLPKMAEIEELIAASESSDQTELTLIRDGDNEVVKLNVADGTFNPRSRDEEYDDELVPLETIRRGTPVANDKSDQTEVDEFELDTDDEMISLDKDYEADDQSDSFDEVENEGVMESGLATDEEIRSTSNRLILNNPVPQGTYGPVGSEDAAEESREDVPEDIPRSE
jgi:segregation and condensation protein B